MRSVIILLTIIYNSLPAIAQTKPVTLTGTLNVNTGETFPYKVVLTEKDGIVSGYSITYLAPDDTKTKIQGTLDRRTHTLRFKETEIVYSHNVPTKAYMCLIDAHLSNSKPSELKGPITSMQADKTSCTGGSLVFNNADEINFLFAYHDAMDTMITMKARKREAPVESAPTATVADMPLVTDKVTAGIEKTYDWYTDTLVIDAWDGGNTDGDRITLLINGKAYLTGYSLVKEKKQLRIPLTTAGISTITIIADNEGSDPPNTASLLFTDGTRRYSMLAYNNKGSKAIIKINRVKH